MGINLNHVYQLAGRRGGLFKTLYKKKKRKKSTLVYVGNWTKWGIISLAKEEVVH